MYCIIRKFFESIVTARRSLIAAASAGFRTLLFINISDLRPKSDI